MVRKKTDSRISKRHRKISVGNHDDDDSIDSDGNIKEFIAHSDSDVSEEPIKKSKKSKKSKKEESDESEEEEEEDTEEDNQQIRINFGGFGQKDPTERLKPKRHDLKKEPESINKFVELITKQAEPTTIDDQIDQFKLLTSDKQKQMLDALERKPDTSEHSIRRSL